MPCENYAIARDAGMNDTLHRMWGSCSAAVHTGKGHLVEEVEQLGVVWLLPKVLLQDAVDTGLQNDIIVARHQPYLQSSTA